MVNKCVHVYVQAANSLPTLPFPRLPAAVHVVAGYCYDGEDRGAQNGGAAAAEWPRNWLTSALFSFLWHCM